LAPLFIAKRGRGGKVIEIGWKGKPDLSQKKRGKAAADFDQFSPSRKKGKGGGSQDPTHRQIRTNCPHPAKGEKKKKALFCGEHPPSGTRKKKKKEGGKKTEKNHPEDVLQL